MIDSARFERIRRDHGGHGSWAIWAPAAARAKAGVGDLTVLDPACNTGLLETLNPEVVMIGLNISRNFSDEPFRNFHDPSPVANDFKIRFAFEGTPFWGAYMTDVVKGIAEPDSGKLRDYLRSHPDVVRNQIDFLRGELAALGPSKPVLLAFGHDAAHLIRQNLPHRDYSVLAQITHYSHRLGREAYRDLVARQVVDARDRRLPNER